jgi:glycosyltransferase involved in cell wall biosynthesis
MSEFLSARKLIKKYKPDILHAHWIIPQGILAVFLKKRYKIPLVVTVHGSDLFPLKNRMFKSIQKTVLENCDACTVNSTATKNEIIARFPQFKSKIAVIPMGVDIKKFSGKTVNKPKKYKNKKIILFVGRLNEQKGIEYLIKSVPYIKSNHPNIKLLIIGEGSYKAHLENVARSLNVRENVDFLWAIPHSKITDYYRMSDVFVLPSITSKIGTEGLGLVLLEAMAAKVPVIGTNTGGIRYTIKNMQNGILVEERNSKQIADGIILLLSNSKLRAKITKNAFKFSNKNYSWDIVVKKFDKLYNKLK